MFRLAPFIILLTITASVRAQDAVQRDYILPSWGDIVCTYGPGVDPALDSPQAFEHMIKYWKGRGFKGVYLRTDLAQLDPTTFRRNATGTQENARLAVAWKYIDEVMARFDVHKVGNAIAEKNGFEFWAWHAHVFSDGAPETAGAPGPTRMWPWSYVVNYTDQHRDAVTTDRTRKKLQWMVREYGYPEARATKVAEFVYMAKAFGLRHFVVENRSEASQMQDPPDHADRFGFNQFVVDDMKKRYGVDILTDPRFDVDSATFNTLDPMVENWHKLRGEYFTQFFRELRKALNEVDPKIQICASVAGERIGPPMGNWVTDWRTWVDEGLINAIISPCDFDAYPTNPKFLDTYLVCAKQGRGMLELSVFQDYIKKSKNPDIQVVSGGSFFFPDPPVGGNAWRITDWYDSYQLAWYQRWGQLMKDLNEFGYIKFFDQNFDKFPVNSSYHAGGWGMPGYDPSLRACPGVWSRLGPANTTWASVQSEIKYGDTGNAVKLTSDPTKSTELTGHHSSTVDRSNYYSCIESAMQNGKVDFDFRLYRDSDDSSIIAYLWDGSTAQKDIGVRVAGTSGELGYSRGGTWSDSGVKVPVRSWQQIRITVDLEKQTYSASLVADQPKQICSDIPLLAPPPRRVNSDDGSERTIDLKSVKMLNQLTLMPQGKTGSVCYVDDISVRWTPKIVYDKPAGKVIFADDFERFGVGEHPLAEKPQVGGQWTLTAGKPEQGVVENQASYGDGFKSLRLHGTTDLVCQPAEQSSKKLVANLDLFVRSSAFYVAIMPGSPTKTSHTVHLAITDERGAELAALQNENGHWTCTQDGQMKATSVPVALDCWNHVQLVADSSTGTYKVVIQPVGEVPTLLAGGRLPASSSALHFGIKTSNSDDLYELKQGSGMARVNFSCIDNVRLTAD